MLSVYLNELSSLCEGMAREDIARHLEAAVVAIIGVRTLRPDTTLRMHCRLSELTLGDEHFALGAILPGTNGRLTQLKGIVDKSPCGPVTTPLQEVQCDGQSAIGLSWADLDDSFALSLGHKEPWSEGSISCVRHSIDESSQLTESNIEVRNLATTEDVGHWRQAISAYGMETTNSSLLYQGTRFVMRMHFHDHPPPHVHIYPRVSDTNDVIARVRVDNGDIMDGVLSSAMNDEIGRLINRYRVELLASWTNIQEGRLPVKIQ